MYFLAWRLDLHFHVAQRRRTTVKTHIFWWEAYTCHSGPEEFRRKRVKQVSKIRTKNCLVLKGSHCCTIGWIYQDAQYVCMNNSLSMNLQSELNILNHHCVPVSALEFLIGDQEHKGALPVQLCFFAFRNSDWQLAHPNRFMKTSFLTVHDCRYDTSCMCCDVSFQIGNYS